MTCFVVALQAEARPILERYRLELVAERPVRTFRGGDRSLIVSGVGKAKAARATEAAEVETSGVWVNVGIAGHRDRPTGELVRIHRITDAETGRRFYPTLVGFSSIPSVGLTTVARAERAFPSDDVYDMEGSGFFETALRSSTAELVQCVKVVSDNAASGVEKLNRERVSELVERNLDGIDALVRHLESMAATLARERARADVAPFIDRWHFTTSEQRRLGRLLERCHAFGELASPESLGRLGSASSVLDAIEERVRRLALEQDAF